MKYILLSTRRKWVGDSWEQLALSLLLLLSSLQLAHAELEAVVLPEPLSVQDVVQIAGANRTEIVAALANAQAASERAKVVSALEAPMLMSSVDHYPFDRMAVMSNEPAGSRFDWSATIEQRFPLSRERSHRRRGAEANARRLLAVADRTALDVELEAVEAFYMLSESRRMLTVVAEQIELAQQMVRAGSARFSAASGGQTEILRAEVEVARLQSQYRATQAEILGMESMLNASLGRPITAPIPALAVTVTDAPIPSSETVIELARAQRPELQAGAAEVAGAEAEVEVMRSMYRPMGLVRLGAASTMAEGQGAMVMVGVSIPLWRDKLRAGVAEARAMKSMAQADLMAMQRMIESDVVRARQGLVAAREVYFALRDEIVPRARMALAPALAGYTSGTDSWATVIDAAQASWSAEAELVMAETNVGVAWARLERATGRLQEIPQ